MVVRPFFAALPRPFIAAFMGALTAFGLFWVMQALVGVTGELQDPGKRLSVDFVRLRRDKTPNIKKREPPKRQKPEQQPPPPEMNIAKNMNPGDAVGSIIPIMDAEVELGKATNLGAGGGSDRDIVPLVRVDPEYPPRAKAQGIEGWVELEFTISPVGTVKEAQVIGSDPAYVFDRAALRAVRRWRYNPKVVENVPVERPGVQVRIIFDLGARNR
jgi:protein TonB